MWAQDGGGGGVVSITISHVWQGYEMIGHRSTHLLTTGQIAEGNTHTALQVRAQATCRGCLCMGTTPMDEEAQVADECYELQREVVHSSAA